VGTLTILPEKYRVVLNRLLEVCEADKRVRAVFLVGSYVRGTADEHSDLDFYLITADDGYDSFLAGRQEFVRQLGQPIFLEDFATPNFVFAIFPGGEEIEIGIGRLSAHNLQDTRPYQVLVDKRKAHEKAMPAADTEKADNVETLRRQIYWFWHDLSHFITAMSRDQLWWAQGQLESLRQYAIALAWLNHNFSDDVGEEIYFKLDTSMPVERLAPLKNSFSSFDKGEILRAVLVIIRYYQDVVPVLASAHGIRYPAELEKVMISRLAALT